MRLFRFPSPALTFSTQSVLGRGAALPAGAARGLLCAVWLLVGGAGLANAEVGTCLTETGVRLAPWTDGHDPACGEDCGAELPGLGCDADALCGVLMEGEALSPASLPPPIRGPVCLESTPECSSSLPLERLLLQIPQVGPTSDFQMEPPRIGLLPGPGPLIRVTSPCSRSERPAVPPPRD